MFTDGISPSHVCVLTCVAGFQTLGACDCFAPLDGSTNICFLPADPSVLCPNGYAGAPEQPTAVLAVALYGVGVPVLYAALLFVSRKAIRDENPTPLSTALSFLHASLHPWALYWPLVEAARAILLTGFLALVTPGVPRSSIPQNALVSPRLMRPRSSSVHAGELFQLLCGQLVAVIFLVLQLWCAPYRTASNNFLAMAINVSLVLNFVSSIGVQVAAKYGIAAVDPMLLSIALYTAAFAVFPITLFTLLLAIRKPTVTPEQLRAYLLDDPDDEPNTGGPSAGVQLPPLVARFGQFSINVEDVTKALNAPLLSANERQILNETVSLVEDNIGSSGIQMSRFTSDPAALVFGQPREAALGIDPFLCVPPNQIRAGMADGVVAIRREIEAAASTGEQTALDTLECLDYIQLSRAGSSAMVCTACMRSLACVECAACLSPHLVLSFLFSDFLQLAPPS